MRWISVNSGTAPASNLNGNNVLQIMSIPRMTGTMLAEHFFSIAVAATMICVLAFAADASGQ
jgi:hypothetical protein